MKTKKSTILLTLLVLPAALWLLWPDQKAPVAVPADSATDLAHDDHGHGSKIPRAHRVRRSLTSQEAVAQGLPRGTFEHVFDRAAGKFLYGKGRDAKFLPNSDAPSGMDLWVQDASGEDRLIHDSVFSAKFSPDGTRIAFTTSDCVLHVQDLQGNSIAQMNGVYGPNWKPDGSAVIFSKVGEGQHAHRPGTRHLEVLDLASGTTTPLTDGRFDDGRPEFHPSSDAVIFVSGSRSGLASFWKVPAGGGEPVQLTNRGMQQVNELFVPTPYDKTLWSGDKRWFIYDFKSGDQQETWGLEFAPDGTMKQATKLADGINPRWQDNGRTLVCEKTVDGTVQTLVSNLP